MEEEGSRQESLEAVGTGGQEPRRVGGPSGKVSLYNIVINDSKTLSN